MSKRQLKSEDVDGFMLATWDSAVDMAEQYDVSIGIGVGFRKDRGRMVFRATAFQTQPDGSEKPVARAEREWPGHYSKTVHGLLYSLLIGLWRALDDWRAEAPEQDSPTEA